MSTYSSPRYTWSATNGTTALSTTASTTLNAAQTSTDYNGNTVKLRNYLTDLYLYNNNSSTATLVNILDGSTVIATFFADNVTAAGVGFPLVFNFTNPLKTTAGNALNIQCVTTGATIYYTAIGFTGA
jgi:hypothetical protein